MALGMWDAVVAANENAQRVVAAQMRSKGQPTYSCGHYAEWLQYAYFQLGRERDGYQLLLDCAREGKVLLDWSRAHPQQAVGAARSPAALKQRLDSSLLSMRAVAIVESPRYRRQAAAMDVDVSDVGRGRGWALFTQGLERAWRGETGAAAGDLAELQKLLAQPPEADEDSHTGAYLQLMAQMLEAVLAERAGELDRALQLLAAASTAYQAIPFDFGPPVPVKPPRELRGELLLAHQRPAEALADFDLALKSAPRRALSVQGRARALAALARAKTGRK
jgi:tetratricopeptide (TPR) repeat protein